MKKWMLALSLLAISLTFFGCIPQLQQPEDEPKVLSRMVVSIDVSCDPEDEEHARHYETAEKVDRMISYLRNLDTSMVLEGDPEDCSGHKYLITVNYSGGDSRTYTQIANQYFREEDEAWQQLSVDNVKLKPLLDSLESDL